MKRPYFRKTISELEKLFIESQLDAIALKDLAEELGHRNVPKARHLLEKIKSANSSDATLDIPVFVDQRPSVKAPKGRLYQGATIFDLDKLVSESPEDVDLIREIRAELTHRNVPKAKALLKRIEATVSGSSSKNKEQHHKPDAKAIQLEPLAEINANVAFSGGASKVADKRPPNDLLELFSFFDLSPNCSDEELEAARRAKLMHFNPINLRLQSDASKELAKIEVSKINLNFRKILDLKSRLG